MRLQLLLLLLVVSFGSLTTAITGNFINATDGFRFIEETMANLEDSGVANWYRQWTIKTRANDPGFTKYGEARTFGKHFLEDPDFDCGLGYNGCSHSPSWVDVKALIPEDLEEARRVYFAMKDLVRINLLLKVKRESLLIAHVQAASQIGDAVVTFTRQADAAADMACKMLKATLAGLAQAAFVSIGTAIAKPLEEVTETVFGYLFQNSFITTAGNDAMNAIMQPAMDEPHKSTLCDGFGGEFVADNPKSISILSKELEKAGKLWGKQLAELSMKLNMGEIQVEDGSSALSMIMFQGHWADEAKVLEILHNPDLMVDVLRTQYREVLVAGAWSAGQCYLKCNEDSEARKMCDETAKDIDHSRICPRDNVVCQGQCWTAIDSGKDMELWGLDKLKQGQWSMDIGKLMLDIYEHSLLGGNKITAGSTEMLPAESVSSFTLPLCFSTIARVTNFKDGSDFGRKSKHFPTSCGDWTSDKTATFYHAMSLGPEDSGYKSKYNEHLFKHRIPRELDGHNPLDRFLAMCEISIEWPHWNKDKQDPFPLQIAFNKNIHCDEMRNITVGRTQEEANIEFCLGPANHILLEESDRIDTDAVNMRGSRAACSRFLEDLGDGTLLEKWKSFREENSWLRGARRGGWT